MYPNLETNTRNHYFNISKFNSVLTKSVSSLTVIHINIHSLFPKLDPFLAFIGQLAVKFDVLCFTECSQTESTKNLVKVQGYNVFHCLREIWFLGGSIAVFLDVTLKLMRYHSPQYQMKWLNRCSTVFIKILASLQWSLCKGARSFDRRSFNRCLSRLGLFPVRPFPR